MVSGGESWILKGICKEIHVHGKLNARHFPSGLKLPKADYYFFAHQSRLIQFLETSDHSGKLIVWFPHFEEHGKRDKISVIQALSRADKIICPARMWKQWLIENGIDHQKVSFVLGAADPKMFRYHERSNNTVGFVSKYYPRKNPDFILGIVQQMPDLQFILNGRNWQEYEKFGELISQPNFRYIEADYSQYPEIYSQMDVFVSPSTVEGGPIPLLEAMMSNIVPVASRTGFAPDVIRHGENGYTFDTNSDVDTVASLIRQALKLKTNVRQTVQHLTWKNFASQLLDFVYQGS
jgi:glycosyltransferase involved in cell wall biosynthesis